MLHDRPIRRLDRCPWFVVLAGAVALCFTIEPCDAVAQEPGRVWRPGEGGRLWNISGEPFKFRLRRTTGPMWTEEMTLAPGEYREFHLPKPGEQSEIQGLHASDPHLSIEYAALGGVLRFRLPARSSSGTVNPFWFYVKDSNGIGQLIQPGGQREVQSIEERLKEAQAAQERYKKDPPMKPEQIEQLKATLYANWVFYPIRPQSDAAGARPASPAFLGTQCR